MPALSRTARDRSRAVRRVLLGLLVANLVVVGAKLIIGLRTGSLGVLGDAVHSSVDAMNNVLALVVTWIAAREPDEDHPYGHEKFETLGALAIVVFLSITGFELVKGAFGRLSSGGAALHVSAPQLAILVGTLGVNAAVSIFEARRGRDLGSQLLLADAAHTRADVFITIGVIVGVLAARAGLTFVDPIVALAIAVMIGMLAYGIVARSVPVLVDQFATPADTIRRAAESIDGVARAYDIRSRGTEQHRFTELTIAVAGDATVEAAHLLADAVEQRLRAELGFHDVVVHVEPC
jgi:cation diffusion facilitator family transporter